MDWTWKCKEKSETQKKRIVLETNLGCVSDLLIEGNNASFDLQGVADSVEVTLKTAEFILTG